MTNPVGGGAGTDLVTGLELTLCQATPRVCKDKVEMIALGLPWPSHLVAGVPVRDVVEGIELEVRCSKGPTLDVFRGTLEPTIGESVAEFGPGVGELEDAAENKGSVSGMFHLEGPHGDKKITVEKAEPTELSTRLSSESRSGATIAVTEGTPVTDEATLSGINASEATGTVEYRVYSDAECKDLVAEAGTVSVTGGVVPPSNAETFGVGTYYWQAFYSGDSENLPSHSACGSEIEEVNQPHWFSEGELIKEGEVVPVRSFSGGEFKTITLDALGAEIMCNVKNAGSVTNPVGGGAGTDLVTGLELTLCQATPRVCKDKVEMIALGLPWPSHLVAGVPVRDVVEGIELEVRCSKGPTLDVFRGTLEPTIGESVAEFGPGVGELEDAAENKGSVSGMFHLEGPHGDKKITAE